MSPNYRPHPGPQTMFHQSAAYEVLYGGAAGGGKTAALLIEAARYVHYAEYSAILFRRTTPQITQPLGLEHESRKWYGSRGRYNSSLKQWRFPNNSVIGFGHLQYEKDVHKYDGGQFAFVGFDQLEQFSEQQYIYIIQSRARSTCGCPVRIRNSANPPGEELKTSVGDPQWVLRRWLPWLGTDEELEQAKLPRAQSGELLWFLREQEVEILVDSNTPLALSRTFIPATVYDNPTLLTQDPEYVSRLESLNLVDRQRLLNGNWHISRTGGVFNRDWFPVTDTYPQGLKWVRYWDLATSVKRRAHYTASCAAAFDRSTGIIFVRDMIRGKWEWPDQKARMMETIMAEPLVDNGIEEALQGAPIFQEFMRDPRLVGKKFRLVHVEADKLQRANTWTPRAKAHKVVLVKGPWIPAFLSEAEVFTGRSQEINDQVDAVSGCVQMLAIPVWKEREYIAV